MLKFIYLLKKKSKRFGVIRSPSSVDLILIIFTVILLYYFRNISRSYFDLAQEREEVEEIFGNHSTMYLLLLLLNSIFVEFEFENSSCFPLEISRHFSLYLAVFVSYITPTHTYLTIWTEATGSICFLPDMCTVICCYRPINTIRYHLNPTFVLIIR